MHGLKIFLSTIGYGSLVLFSFLISLLLKYSAFLLTNFGGGGDTIQA